MPRQREKETVLEREGGERCERRREQPFKKEEEEKAGAPGTVHRAATKKSWKEGNDGEE